MCFSSSAMQEAHTRKKELENIKPNKQKNFYTQDTMRTLKNNLYPFSHSTHCSYFYQKKLYFTIFFSFSKQSAPQDSQFFYFQSPGSQEPSPQQSPTSSLGLRTALVSS